MTINVVKLCKTNLVYKTGVLCDTMSQRLKGGEMHAVSSLLDCRVPNIAFPSPLWVGTIKEIDDPLEAGVPHEVRQWHCPTCARHPHKE